MKIALGADHRGYEAKARIKALLEEMGEKTVDFGTDSTKSADYPDPAFAAASAVQKGECDGGILFCGTGIGMSITANKLHGIRAALCHDELTAEMSRRHNNSNMLCLPADLVGDALMRRIVESWLRTEFEGGRHERRIEKIGEIEKKQCKP
ncbi:MAG TPA: ribose 5-phosphate isomerase B [Phycisphaerae bacterium]|nr:ribose 5-phosphate isomerase B [Phycisphaerae bacterium]